jgi:hypothetical protein
MAAEDRSPLPLSVASFRHQPPIRPGHLPKRCRMFPIRCQVFLKRFRMFPKRCQMFPIRCRVFPIRCQVFLFAINHPSGRVIFFWPTNIRMCMLQPIHSLRKDNNTRSDGLLYVCVCCNPSTAYERTTTQPQQSARDAKLSVPKRLDKQKIGHGAQRALKQKQLIAESRTKASAQSKSAYFVPELSKRVLPPVSSKPRTRPPREPRADQEWDES